ncbi:uncharacterized protein BDR25DRAFT_299522 [Lindgomyces ingoldianus]|uniref:Uncharacterized protein n=1 Tax=Lindgomyces ingoldianus TaxID=673940 RepID=A0ACB6RF50_9PLEO|nr:uncharacterized protein BDR25DRAFT_299522 [Lindgomyces ingoldianus]KAF2477675.1 hypothetical protein BDR25DRAFT_299522 [Lindgomyces ingoldianus]
MENSKRKTPVEVLHLSMPRTGSVSMMAAYNALGLSTYHGFDFIARPSDQILWEKAIDAKFYGRGRPFEKDDFDAFLGDFQVLSDFPVLGFTEEFIKMYPHAKVVLVERDLEKWYHSFSSQVIAASYTWMVWIMLKILDPYFMRARPATLMLKMEYGMFNCSDRAGFEKNAKETYRKHYELVRRSVPKERILEYQLGSGWKPLCDFLGKPTPDGEFPFMNESKEFAIWMHKTQIRVLKSGLKTMLKTLCIPVGVGIAAYVMLK